MRELEGLNLSLVDEVLSRASVYHIVSRLLRRHHHVWQKRKGFRLSSGKSRLHRSYLHRLSRVLWGYPESSRSYGSWLWKGSLKKNVAEVVACKRSRFLFPTHAQVGRH